MSKYGAVKTVIDGITFASGKEGRRYSELKLMQRAGLISALECHPEYPIIVSGVKVSKYIGDFRYAENGVSVLEDVKGVQTPIFRLKAKLIKALYGVEIRIT